MSWLFFIFTFAVLWWILLFTVLPFGVRSAENPVPGQAASAPENPRLRLKFLVTTVLALAGTFALRWVVESGLISVHS